jgi:hypothetical protein
MLIILYSCIDKKSGKSGLDGFYNLLLIGTALVANYLLKSGNTDGLPIRRDRRAVLMRSGVIIGRQVFAGEILPRRFC